MPHLKPAAGLADAETVRASPGYGRGKFGGGWFRCVLVPLSAGSAECSIRGRLHASKVEG
jgi:hypothetical protein